MNRQVDPDESEGGQAPDSVDQNPETMPLEDLKGLLERSLEPAPPSVEEPSPGPEPAEKSPETPAETPAVEEPAEIDVAAERAKLDAERERTKYEALQQHASRLASRIGDLEQRLKQRQDPPQEYAEREIPAEVDSRIQELERRFNDEAVSRAIAEEIGRVDANQAISKLDLRKELAEVGPKYAEQYKTIIAMQDPKEARLAARDLSLSVMSEAMGLRLERAASTAEAGKTAAKQQNVQRKIAASVSGSGGTRVASRAKPPDPQTMPLDDLKKMIEQAAGE